MHPNSRVLYILDLTKQIDDREQEKETRRANERASECMTERPRGIIKRDSGAYQRHRFPDLVTCLAINDIIAPSLMLRELLPITRQCTDILAPPMTSNKLMVCSEKCLGDSHIVLVRTTHATVEGLHINTVVDVVDTLPSWWASSFGAFELLVCGMFHLMVDSDGVKARLQVDSKIKLGRVSELRLTVGLSERTVGAEVIL